MKAVQRILDALGAPYALIGGHALAARGYPRFTVPAVIWISGTLPHCSRSAIVKPSSAMSRRTSTRCAPMSPASGDNCATHSMDDAASRTIEARTHGRYLVRPPAAFVARARLPLLVGFHGYRENAAIQLQRLAEIPGADSWLIVSVQGLHRFYMRGGDVVASWMTREDRELAIADNIAYVGSVLQAVRAEYHVDRPLVFAGFSQGVAMAFRAAAATPCDGLIVFGADVPPDVVARPAVSLPPVLYGHGARDEIYTSELHARDLQTLDGLGVTVERSVVDAGHDWNAAFAEAAGRFLGKIRP